MTEVMSGHSTDPGPPAARENIRFIANDTIGSGQKNELELAGVWAHPSASTKPTSCVLNA